MPVYETKDEHEAAQAQAIALVAHAGSWHGKLQKMSLKPT